VARRERMGVREKIRERRELERENQRVREEKED